MGNVPDSMLSTVFGHPAFTVTDEVKSFGKGIFNEKDSIIDVHFDWHTNRTAVAEGAFGKNAHLHVRHYEGKREDFHYFAFNLKRYRRGW
ncbi:hypothetical protein Barb6XT_02849 [Bacteroidales bacterium Barb6XT]|nr:hypothetical protein Barb6XT_02849 [Bacteroidales bacterium Barb6XT]